MKNVHRLCLGLSLIAALAAAGCAHRAASHATPATAQGSASSAASAAPRITVYPASVGQWRDLGAENAPWLAGEMPVPVARAATRAVGLRDAEGRWLALVIVQAAPAQSAGCTALESLRVSGGASGRASKNCLRMRRDALFDHYLERQNPALWAWLGQRGLTPPPAAWVAARVPDGQQLLEVHALLEPSLLEAVTRSNDDFLNAGHAGVDWSRQLARAAQAAAASGALAVPPFPYAPAPRVTEPAPPPAEPARPAPEADAAQAPARKEEPAPGPQQAQQVIERKERIEAPRAAEPAQAEQVLPPKASKPPRRAKRKNAARRCNC